MVRRARASLPVVVAFGALLTGSGVLSLARSVGADEPKPSVPAVDPAASPEGATPLPEGAWKITFPWEPRQSILFVSDAPVARTVGAVNFSDSGTKPLGTISLDGKGGGTGAFAVTVTDISTLSPERDASLRGDKWLDAKKFPEISYAITKLEKVKPTVYRVTGTWKMHGVEREISVLADVRFVPKLQGLEAPNGIARLKAKLSFSLKAFGIENPLVGSAVVADQWDAELVVLGVLAKP